MQDNPSTSCCICGREAARPDVLLYRRMTIPMRLADIPEDRSARRRIREEDLRALRDAPRSLRITIEIPDMQGDPHDAFCASCARAALARQLEIWFPELQAFEDRPWAGRGTR